MIILPDDVTLLSACLVMIASFFTSALTAGLGLGGGLMLLAIMSGLLPPLAVIPIHGVAQLGSNLGRFVIQRHHIQWNILWWFLLGAILGAYAGGRVYVSLPEWILRAGVAIFILGAVWGPKPAGFAPGKFSFFGTGLTGSFLTMFFGATGPIVASMLNATKLNRLQFSATHAACMVAQHCLKILAFGLLGFAFYEWIPLLAAILFFGFLGTITGTRILQNSSEIIFKKGLKAVLTVLALYLLVAAIIAIFKIN